MIMTILFTGDLSFFKKDLIIKNVKIPHNWHLANEYALI